MNETPPSGTGDAGVPRDASDSHDRFVRTLVSVLLVQAATLLLLWLLQARYHG